MVHPIKGTGGRWVIFFCLLFFPIWILYGSGVNFAQYSHPIIPQRSITLSTPEYVILFWLHLILGPDIQQVNSDSAAQEHLTNVPWFCRFVPLGEGAFFFFQFQMYWLVGCFFPIYQSSVVGFLSLLFCCCCFCFNKFSSNQSYRVQFQAELWSNCITTAEQSILCFLTTTVNVVCQSYLPIFQYEQLRFFHYEKKLPQITGMSDCFIVLYVPGFGLAN